mgnify:FL=1
MDFESTQPNMDKKLPSPPHILIIDDDLDQLRLLVAALRTTSYRVSVALNGDQGYARAMVLQPSLILLDVCMPGRSGITVAGLLKSNPTTQSIPVIFLSALANPTERLAGLKAGAVDYIIKPFDADELLERIRIHLDLSQQKIFSPTDGSESDDAEQHAPDEGFQSANQTLNQVAKEFIRNHINESYLKMSDVAAHLGASIQKLNAVFEACDGITAFEFMRRERTHRAALMLGQSTLTIAEVAMEVGYANPANFSTEFKKFWGKSPTQLRNQSQENMAFLQDLMMSKRHGSDTPPTHPTRR